MKKLLVLFVFAAATLLYAQSQTQPTPQDIARWENEARRVTVIRDDWGIAHVYGKTDADAVFGMEYAQAEDDFNRVETNYINAMGRLAEAEGDPAVYKDLRMKLFIDPAEMQAKYASSPDWLKKLMNAFADGLNYYLYKHPEVKPRVITHFEPWMALTFTEGSIGGDIEDVDLKDLAAFYGASPQSPGLASVPPMADDSGSNGIAISPSIALNHHALLWINPHTSFYFRSELQMVSEEGLDAYGAATWGQFFIYQGFNARCGWMHTSSGVQNVDRFLETVAEKDARYTYKYGDKELPVTTRTITVPYKTVSGMAEKAFTVYYTQHGPVIAKVGDKWETISLMQNPVDALIQDFTRIKAKGYADFRKALELHTNSSNNTVFADADGNIAYWHSDYIPKRDDSFDWTKPVDGSNPATAYHGLLSVDETPHVLNPANGWLYNSNNWPWSAAGKNSPKQKDFPKYVEKGHLESPRGYHALRLLNGSQNWTAASLTGAAFDSYLPAFAMMVPVLVKDYDGLSSSDPLKAKLSDQITVLRSWDYRWGINSVPTSLAVYWGADLNQRGLAAQHIPYMLPEEEVDWAVHRATPQQMLDSLAAASDRLTADFGSWQTPWGQINRFQRLDDSIAPHFDDSKKSIPIPFTYSRWGSLASYSSRPYPNTKQWYGDGGNSFVAVVEFGPKVQAWAVTAGGESGDPKSSHFDDEAVRYSTGNLREVYFYRDQLKGHTEREYHPGQ